MSSSVLPISTPLPSENSSPRPSTGGATISTDYEADVNHPEKMLLDRQAVSFACWTILILGLVLRLMVIGLGPATAIERAITPESITYQELGQNWFSEGLFALPEASKTAQDIEVDKLRMALGQLERHTASEWVYETQRLPGYAGLLGLWDTFGLPMWLMLLMQCLLSAACGVLAYQIVREMFSQAVYAPWIAGLILCLHPSMITASVTFSPETIFVFLMLFGIWGLLKKERSTSLCIFSGLSIGAALLIRPYFWALGPVLAVWMLMRERKASSFSPALVFALAAMVLPGAWMFRNHQIGLGAQLSTAPAINRYFEDTASILFVEGENAIHNQEAQTDYLITEWFKQTDAQTSAYTTLNSMVLDIWQQSPGQLLEVLGTRFAQSTTQDQVPALMHVFGIDSEAALNTRTILEINASAEQGQDLQLHYMATAWIAANAMMLALAAAGCLLLIRRGEWTLALLFSGLFVYLLFNLYPTGQEQFALILIALEAIILSVIFTKPKPREKKISLLKQFKPKNLDAFNKKKFDIFGRPIKNAQDDDEEEPLGEGDEEEEEMAVGRPI